jgi:hypothetical protein
MFGEGRSEFFSCFSDRESGGMRGICAGGAVIEQDGRKRTGTRWRPKESFEAESATGNDDGFRTLSWQLFRRQHDARHGKQQCHSDET